MGVCLKIMTGYPGIWTEREYQKDFFPSTRHKADPAQFAQWCQNQPKATQDLFVSGGEDARWAKIRRALCGKVQEYVICLDPHSQFAGNLYNKDDEVTIYSKLFAGLVYRPLHAALYTLYNITLIHAVRIVVLGIINNKPVKETWKKVGCSLADIARIPIYSVAIMIVTIAGLLVAPFHSEWVYDIRALVGRLNRELGWGERKGLHDYMPCMQPLVNIMEYTLNAQEIGSKRAYVDVNNSVLVALDNRIGEYAFEIISLSDPTLKT